MVLFKSNFDHYPHFPDNSLMFVRVFCYNYSHLRTWSASQWLKCCATNRKVAGSIPADVIWIFHWHKILPIALWPWGRHRLQQKWVPGAFPGGKGGRCVRLTTLPPSYAVVMKSGNFNFMEPSGPLRACNGTGLTFTWNVCCLGLLVHWLLVLPLLPTRFLQECMRC